MLSYFEAITLAPARCAQILNTGREGRSAIGLAVDRGFSALERFYARVLGTALANPWKVLAGRSSSRSASLARGAPHQDRVHPRAGSEPAQRAHHHGERAPASSPRAPPHRAQPRRALGPPRGLARPHHAQRLQRIHDADARPALRSASSRRRALSAELRKDLQSIPGIRASVQDPSQQELRHRSGGYPDRFHGARIGLGHARRTPTMKLKTELEASGLVTDLTTRTTRSAARAAGGARSPARHGSRRLGERAGQHGERARRRQRGRQVLERGPPRRHPHAPPRAAAHPPGGHRRHACARRAATAP